MEHTTTNTGFWNRRVLSQDADTAASSTFKSIPTTTTTTTATTTLKKNGNMTSKASLPPSSSSSALSSTSEAAAADIFRSLHYFRRNFFRKEFLAERTTLIRLHYKSKNQHRGSMHLRKMEEVKRILNRFDDLNLEASLDELLVVMSQSTTGSKKAIKKASSGTGEFVSPPYELSGIILTRLVGAYALLDKLTGVLESAYGHFRAIASQTYFMPLALASMGIMARLWVLSKKMRSDLDAAYKSLRWNLQNLPRTNASSDTPQYETLLPESIDMVMDTSKSAQDNHLRDDVGEMTLDDLYGLSNNPPQSKVQSRDNLDSSVPEKESNGNTVPDGDDSPVNQTDSLEEGHNERLSDLYGIADDFWNQIDEPKVGKADTKAGGGDTVKSKKKKNKDLMEAETPKRRKLENTVDALGSVEVSLDTMGQALTSTADVMPKSTLPIAPEKKGKISVPELSKPTPKLHATITSKPIATKTKPSSKIEGNSLLSTAKNDIDSIFSSPKMNTKSNAIAKKKSTSSGLLKQSKDAEEKVNVKSTLGEVDEEPMKLVKKPDDKEKGNTRRKEKGGSGFNLDELFSKAGVPKNKKR